MKRTLVFAAALAALVVAGCSGASNPLVGTWEGTTSMMNIPVNVVQELKADGTYVTTSNLNAPMGGKVSVEAKGKWESKSKEELVLTVESTTVLEAPAQAKGELQKQLDQMKGQAQTFTIAWTSNDEVTMSGGPGQPYTLKRKK